MMKRKEHLTIEGIRKIVAIKASINNGLPVHLLESFSDVIPCARPEVKFTGNLDPHWLAGFVSVRGGGTFYIRIRKSLALQVGAQVLLRFTITQHSRDQELMQRFIALAGCGKIEPDYRGSAVSFVVYRFSDIYNNICIFFKKYEIEGNKKHDFLDFCKVADTMKDGGHLTLEGL